MPRDPDRINKILASIERLWERCPDVRLGQLIMNVIRSKDISPEIFYIEDDKFMEKLMEFEKLVEATERK